MNSKTGGSNPANQSNTTRRKSSTHLTNESTSQILTKNPDLRTHQEKQSLIQMIESLAYFKKEILAMLYQNQLMETLIKNLNYECFDATKAIYHEGDTSDSFYIVLKGKVRLYTPRSGEEIEQDRFFVQNHSVSTPASSWNKAIVQPSPCLRSNNTLSPGMAKYKNQTSSFPVEQPSPTTPLKANHLGAMRAPLPSKHKSLNLSNQHFKFGAGDIALSLNKSKSNKSSEPGLNSEIRKAVSQLSVVTQFPFTPNLQRLNMTINKGISEEDQQVLAQISKSNRRYVQSNGICEFSMQREVHSGTAFGTITSTANARQETAVAFTAVQVLSLSAKKYMEIFEEPIRERRERIVIFKRIFSDPSLDQHISKCAEQFQHRRYDLRECIYRQGSSPNGLYMILKGEVRMSYGESYKIEPSARRLEKTGVHTTEVVRLAPYQFFGGEELLGLQTRSFTAESSSEDLELLYLESSFIHEPVHYTRDFLGLIEKMCRSQSAWESKHLEEIRERVDRKVTSVDEKDSYRLCREYHLTRAGFGYNHSSESRYKIKRVRSPGALLNKLQQSSVPLKSGSDDYQLTVPSSKLSVRTVTHANEVKSSVSYKKSRSITEGPIDTWSSNKDLNSFVLYQGTGDSVNLELKLARRKEIKVEKEEEDKPIPIGSKISLLTHILGSKSSSKSNRAKQLEIKGFKSYQTADSTPKSRLYSRNQSDFNGSLITLASNIKSPTSFQNYDEIREEGVSNQDVGRKTQTLEEFTKTTMKFLFSQPRVRSRMPSHRSLSKTNVINEYLKQRKSIND